MATSAAHRSVSFSPGMVKPGDDEAEQRGADDRHQERADDPAPEAVGDEHREVPDGDAHHDPDDHAHRLSASRASCGLGCGRGGPSPRRPGSSLLASADRARRLGRRRALGFGLVRRCRRGRLLLRAARCGLAGAWTASDSRSASPIVAGGERGHDAVVLGHDRPPAAHVDRLALLPQRQHRRGDEDRRVGARGDADQQREGEVLQRLAAEEHQRARPATAWRSW